MASKPAWRRDLDEAFETVEVAWLYAEDGAYLTAADRLETAAKLMRSGNAKRQKALERAIAKAAVQP